MLRGRGGGPDRARVPGFPGAALAECEGVLRDRGVCGQQVGDRAADVLGGGRGRWSWRQEGGESWEGCEGEGWARCKRVLEGEGICRLVDEAGASDESKDHGGILWKRLMRWLKDQILLGIISPSA